MIVTRHMALNSRSNPLKTEPGWSAYNEGKEIHILNLGNFGACLAEIILL